VELTVIGEPLYLSLTDDAARIFPLISHQSTRTE
jgi:hypothetical protein